MKTITFYFKNEKDKEIISLSLTFLFKTIMVFPYIVGLGINDPITYYADP